MREKDLPIDLTKHKVYSKNAKSGRRCSFNTANT